MGRVSKYKRVKSFDPYSKQSLRSGKNPKKDHGTNKRRQPMDMAPTSASQKVPKSVSRLFHVPHKKWTEDLPDNLKDVAKATMQDTLKRSEGETLEAFNTRVDKEASTKAAATVQRATNTSKKKKKFLTEKKQGKKERSKTDEYENREQRVFGKDKGALCRLLEELNSSLTAAAGCWQTLYHLAVQFREVAMEPPAISAKPRKAKTAGPRDRKKRSGLILAGAPQKQVKPAPAKALALEKERQHAVSAYREFKRLQRIGGKAN